MASAMYPAAITAMMTGGVNFDTDDIRAILVDLADYTYSSAHDFLDDVAAGARVATFTLANTSVAAGVFDADDGTWSSVTGDPSEAIILYNHNGGSDAARRLLLFIDGISVTPNGGNINCAWDNGANKIAKVG